jgi:hypothetical protein
MAVSNKAIMYMIFKGYKYAKAEFKLSVHMPWHKEE